MTRSDCWTKKEIKESLKEYITTNFKTDDLNELLKELKRLKNLKNKCQKDLIG